MPFPHKNIQKAMVNFKDGYLRVCGGRTKGQKVLDACYVFEKGSGWVPSFHLTQPRFASTITSLFDGSLWIAGGISSKDSQNIILSSSEILTKSGDILVCVKFFN